MATTAETIVVITDANVLINFLQIGQLELLGKLDAHRFLVPEEVMEEITDPAQREALAAAIAAGYLEQVVVDLGRVVEGKAVLEARAAAARDAEA